MAGQGTVPIEDDARAINGIDCAIGRTLKASVEGWLNGIAGFSPDEPLDISDIGDLGQWIGHLSAIRFAAVRTAMAYGGLPSYEISDLNNPKSSHVYIVNGMSHEANKRVVIGLVKGIWSGTDVSESKGSRKDWLDRGRQVYQNLETIKDQIDLYIGLVCRQ